MIYGTGAVAFRLVSVVGFEDEEDDINMSDPSVN
jgi:hypothetical protein